MTLAIKKLAELENTKTHYGYTDFEIYVDGKCDGNYYRQNSNESTFKKLYGIKGNWGKTIRGNARAKIQKMLNDMIQNKTPFMITVIQ